MKIIKQIKFLILLSLVLLLTSCGFQLRGSAPVTGTVALEQNDGIEPVAQIVRQAWQAQEVQFAPAERADFRVKLLQERIDRYVITGFNSTSAAQQYQVVDTLYFSIITKAGKVLVANGHLSAAALATQNNTQQYNPDLVENLRTQLADQLLWRLGAVQS